MNIQRDGPVIKIKVLGRSSGSRTLIVNSKEIAIHLNRDPDGISKFFGYLLGTLSYYKKEEEQIYLYGMYTFDNLTEVLNNFTDQFVQCGDCLSLVTEEFISSNTIAFICRNCGKTTLCDPQHKYVQFRIRSIKRIIRLVLL